MLVTPQDVLGAQGHGQNDPGAQRRLCSLEGFGWLNWGRWLGLGFLRVSPVKYQLGGNQKRHCCGAE